MVNKTAQKRLADLAKSQQVRLRTPPRETPYNIGPGHSFCRTPFERLNPITIFDEESTSAYADMMAIAAMLDAQDAKRIRDFFGPSIFKLVGIDRTLPFPDPTERPPHADDAHTPATRSNPSSDVVAQQPTGPAPDET